MRDLELPTPLWAMICPINTKSSEECSKAYLIAFMSSDEKAPLQGCPFKEEQPHVLEMNVATFCDSLVSYKMCIHKVHFIACEF